MSNFQLYMAVVIITGKKLRAAYLDVCLAITAFSSESFCMCHTCCDAAPPFLMAYPKKNPVIITFEFRALDEGAITTYFNVLGLTQPAQALDSRPPGCLARALPPV
jgi:hypothetical protein